ncbi:MAG TPA: PEP-CTERM sorting domain-containing protein [Anaerohalosphaeraceae bacterium]|nr:PEP-CTERM sorting domain-containing protein [Anaerohalosphaeraceae bacterium]
MERRQKKNEAMKQVMAGLILALLVAGSASAEFVSATDGDGNLYGNTECFRVDFDATPASMADWNPDLVSGQTYKLDFVSIRNGSNSDATPLYLGVYSGFSAGTWSGFLGVSDNAIDFAAVAAGAWAQYTFTGISVTVDAAVGSGSGMLYFLFQTGTAARTTAEVNRSIQRNNGYPGDPVTGDWLANIIAYGGVVDSRAPEYQAQLTIPEPATMVLLSLGSLAIFRKRK